MNDKTMAYRFRSEGSSVGNSHGSLCALKEKGTTLSAGW